MKLSLKILSLLPYLFVFLFALYVPTDPDLGWHLKNGEYFFQTGTILRDNIYSTLLPNYHWANTSWLTDILTYGIYSMGGFLGLTILGGLIVALTFYFYSKVAKLTLWDQVFLFPLILYLVQPINAVSFRGQQITLLFIGVLFYLFSLYPKHPKVLYLTMPLFLLWANLHGQFIFGLGLFGLWIGLHTIQTMYKKYSSLRVLKSARQSPSRLKSWWGLLRQRRDSLQAVRQSFLLPRNDVKLVGIFAVCVVSTFINPFGWGIHSAALSHVGSPLLQYIAEYLPFEMLSIPWWNQVMAGVLLTFGFLALLFRNKVMEKLPLLGVGIIIFLFSFEVRRYAWPAYYLILPLLTPLSAYLRPDNKRMTQILSGIFALILVGIAITSRFPFTQFTTYSWEKYCVQTKCSPKAATFIVDNKLTDNLYTLYGWGGWLIWNYPEIKPVIDGRMHLWKDGEYSAFEEYYALEQNTKDIDATKYNTVLIAPDKALHERLIKLENAGKWKMVYNDKNASVFVRK